MNYELLKAELLEPAYNGLSDADTATLINSETVSIKQRIETHAVQQYLMLTDLLILIESGTSDAAKTATRALQIFESFDMNNPLIEGKFTAILDGLVADALIGFTNTNKLTILSLGNKTISRATELGFGVVREGDIKFARSL